MADRTIGIAMLGCGVVGTGVLDILLRQGEALRRRTGLRFDLRHVVVRDPQKYAARTELRGLPFTSDARRVMTDTAVKIVVEVMGGTDAADELIRAALDAGKRVVTANKALLALRGDELFALARRKGVCIGFEASCGGGVPIIGALQHGLVANRIHALIGIVNGTCNFILTRMTRNGLSYEDALNEAQRAGFAEADPTLDVSGRDAAQKLAILGGLAFNARIRESDIHVEGIDRIDPLDIRFAGELGYVIKLLAIGEAQRNGLSLRVHPALVHRDDVLADVGGSFNAVSVWGDALGHALFYGRGAGSTPTASAVASDIVDMALGVTDAAFNQLRIFPDLTPAARVLPFAELRSRYYLRLMAKDEPGVLAQVTHILGEQGISLSAILQHEMDEGNSVPVIITTHMAREGAMQLAVAQIDRLEAITAPGVCLRIIDSPEEFGRNEDIQSEDTTT
jgi:homoserine dehydrogenase